MRSPAQTANNAQKTQNEAATPASLQDFGCQAMCFDILDETQGPRGGQDNEGITVTSVGTGTDSVGEDVAGLSFAVRSFVNDTVSVALVSPGCLLNTLDISRPLGPGEREAMIRAAAAGAGGTKKGKGVAAASGTGVGGHSGMGGALSSGAHASGTYISGGASGLGHIGVGEDQLVRLKFCAFSSFINI